MFNEILTKEEIILIDNNGNNLTEGKPSSEKFMHIDIYNSRDDRLKNSMIVYLKTIKDNSNTKYVIVNFIKNNQNYYASLLLGGNNE